MQRKLSIAKNIVQKIQFIDHFIGKLRLKSDLQHEGPVSLPLLLSLVLLRIIFFLF